MSGTIIDGKKHAIDLRQRIKIATNNLKSKYGITQPAPYYWRNS